MPHILKKYGESFAPGDVIVVNDPYAGVTHMPDVMIIAPTFWQGQRVAFTLAYSHHTDIGGRFPGGFSSQCSETFEEGLRLPPIKLYAAGERNDALLETILANVPGVRRMAGRRGGKNRGLLARRARAENNARKIRPGHLQLVL